MEPVWAQKLKDSISVKVFAQKGDGWRPVAAKLSAGVIEIDGQGNTPDAHYNAILEFGERFKEIGSGSILTGDVRTPIYHQTGLDTKWEASFAGNALMREVRFTLRDGEQYISIPVQYRDLPQSTAQAKPNPLVLAVRCDYQLANVMWRGLDAHCAHVAITVKAVEGDSEYTVETVHLPISKSYLAVDKLAAGQYNVRLTQYDAAEKVLEESEPRPFAIPQK